MAESQGHMTLPTPKESESSRCRPQSLEVTDSYYITHRNYLGSSLSGVPGTFTLLTRSSSDILPLGHKSSSHHLGVSIPESRRAPDPSKGLESAW